MPIADQSSSVLMMPHPRPVQPTPGKSSAIRNTLLVIFAIVFVSASLWSGLKLREWIYPAASPIYFWPDMLNAWHWGTYTVTGERHRWGQRMHQPGAPGVTWSIFIHRLRTVYQRDERNTGPSDDYRLDYVPGKMAIIALWNWHERTIDPNARRWHPSRMEPLLWLNTAIELLGTVAMFLLVRFWINRRSQPPPLRRTWRQIISPWQSQAADASDYTAPPASTRGWVLGLIAAAIFWFNPAAIQSAHTWVQYDIWIVPFYILAVYFASHDWFFLAGVAIGLGALLKGQQFFVAAIFVLWPLFELRWLKAIDFIVGLAVTFGLLISPWMLQAQIDWIFLAGTILAAILAGSWIYARRRFPALYGVLFLVPALPLVLWPWLTGRVERGFWIALLLAVWICGAPWIISIRRAWFYIAVAVAGALVLTALTLPAEFGWLRVGYAYGTHHYMKLSFPDTCGLQNILAQKFHWRLLDTLFTLHLPWTTTPCTINMRFFLFDFYVMTLVLAALGAAMQHRRNDSRFLIAMITPWITFFALAPQMHERYLIWGATMLASVALAVDGGAIGLMLLGIFLSLLTVSMVLAVQLVHNGIHWRDLQLIRSTEPGLGYAVLLAGAICLYLSLAIRKRLGLSHNGDPRPHA